MIAIQAPFFYNTIMERLRIPGHSLANFLLGAYIVALPFHRAVWKLPFFAARLQPAELALGILALYGLVLVISGRVKYWFSPFDIPVLLWLAVNIFGNALAGYSSHLLLETSKVLAVVLVYFLFRLLVADDFLRRFSDIFLFSALIASLLAIAGSILSLFGMQTVLVIQMQTYPYIGKIGRAMAFTSTPNMLGSILMTALLLKSAQLFEKKTVKNKEIAVLAICLLAFVVAISKTILCFLLGFIILLLLALKKKPPFFKFFAILAMFGVIMVYLLASHFVFSPALTPRVLENMQHGHITRVYHKLGPLLAIETSYLTIKRSCWHVVKNTFPLGVGTRNFKAQVPPLKEKGIYNRETESFDPHCTPLGTLTELGLPGIVVLLFLFAAVGRGLWILWRRKTYAFHYINTGFIAVFAAMSLESWVTDIMNFRHYWLLLGILATMSRQASQQGKDMPAE
jgi:O-antigen ligase